MSVLAVYWSDVQLAALRGTSLAASLSPRAWVVVVLALGAAAYGFDIKGRR